jgi:hypothetical protein
MFLSSVLRGAFCGTQVQNLAFARADGSIADNSAFEFKHLPASADEASNAIFRRLATNGCMGAGW